MAIKKKNPSKSVSTSAAKAKSLLASAEQALSLEEAPLTKKERRVCASFARLTPAVIRRIAATVAEADPSTTQALEEGLAFEATMLPVAQAARAIATKVEDALLDRHAQTAERAYAAYQTLKGLVRLPQGKHLRPQVEEIESLLKLGKRKPKGATAAPPPAMNEGPPAEAPIAKPA